MKQNKKTQLTPEQIEEAKAIALHSMRMTKIMNARKMREIKAKEQNKK